MNTSKPESCSTCNRYTEKGKHQLSLEYRARPISNIDLSRPMSELIQQIRSDLRDARGKLNDIGMGFTGMTDRVAPIEGLLTCGLMALHHLLLEAQKRETDYPREKQQQPESAGRTHAGNMARSPKGNFPNA